MRIAALFALLSILVGLRLAFAESAKAAPLDQEKQSLEDFAKDHSSCREWTDGCLICVRNGEGGFACSLPGIACQPKKLTCGHAMMAPSPSPPQTPMPPQK